MKTQSESEPLSGFQDLLPTLAELANTAVPSECDGLSLVPTLLGRGTQALHPYLYWSFDQQGGKTAVLQWPWKLIHLHTGGLSPGKPAQTAPPPEVQLFNLNEDPGETTNVASAHPERVAELGKAMKEAYRPPVRE